MKAVARTNKWYLMPVIFAAFIIAGSTVLAGCSRQKNEPEEEFAVVFYTNGGSSVESQSVKKGGKIKKPADPTKSGEQFLGWYCDNAFSAEWRFDEYTVEGVTVLYAKWSSSTPADPGADPTKPEQFVVAFISNSGSSVQSQLVESGSKVVKPADPTRDGYRFCGWYSDSALTRLWVFESDVVTKTTVLYAYWQSVSAPVTTYTVNFNVKGGSAVSSQTVESGSKVVKPADPTRDGYRFDGWYADSGCTTAWDFDRDTVKSNTTIYAKWTENNNDQDQGGGEVVPGNICVTFNVGLDARKAGLSNPPAQYVASGSAISAPAASLPGSTLAGWYVENGNTKWNFATDTVTSTMTLFAKWSAGGGEQVDYTPAMRDDNTLYIHYLRSDNSYTDWTIYVWHSGNKTYTEYTVDKSGAVFAVKPSDVGLDFSGNTEVNFIVTQPGWNKDGGDNKVKLSDAMRVGNSYHWFVRQNNTNAGTAYLVSVGSGGGNDRQTEPKRASVSNVDRSYAQNLPVCKTVPGWENAGVGYQIFVASFCDSDGNGTGDIRGIINKLDYLQSLNVNVLWLTPIQSSNSNHGYDCYDYYSIDSKFGTNADYRELVYNVHRRGMKIVMDLVVNHTSPQNEWFQKSKDGVIEEVTYQDGRKATVNYRDFYRWSNSGGNRKYSAGDGWYYYSSFGSSMPELNYDYQPVRDAMVDVASYWMGYGLDGFRMDAIKHMFMWDESQNDPSDSEGRHEEAASGYNFNMSKDVEFFKEFNYKLKTKYPHCFLLGENLTGDVSAVGPFYQGMDSLFDFNSYFDMPGKISSGSAGDIANALNSNAQQYADNRGDRPINSMISSNHDVNRLSAKLSAEKSRVYLAIMMTMPGLSWIYYGDEIGLREKGGGDNAYRQSMKWTSDYADKCTVIGYGGANDGVQSVHEQMTGSGDSLLKYVMSLTALRKQYPAFVSGTAQCSSNGSVLKIEVSNSSQRLVAYHNLSGSQQTVSQSGTAVFGSATLGAYGTAVFLV